MISAASARAIATVGRDMVGLQQHTTIGTHGECLTDLLLRRIRSEGNHGHFTHVAVLLLQLQRGFDRPEIKVVDVVLEACVFDAGAVSGNGELHFHDRDALDAHGDLHRGRSVKEANKEAERSELLRRGS